MTDNDLDGWAGMLDELLEDDSDTLTAWEVEFIESLQKQRAAAEDFKISPKQLDVLCGTWQRICGPRSSRR